MRNKKHKSGQWSVVSGQVPSKAKAPAQLTTSHRSLTTLLLFSILLLTTGCTKKVKVEFRRFDKMLFTTSESSMASHHGEYDSELINFYPDDTAYMSDLREFINDTVVRYIYQVSDSLYGDLSDVEKQLGKALTRAAKMYPEMRKYDRFYTLVTADFESYNYRVFCNDHELAVAIDQYAVGAMDKYGHFGLPNYIIGLCTREHIAPDCMAAIIDTHKQWPKGQLSLLDCMISEGKTLYFLEKVMPDVPDTILLRYTGSQLAWMESNVEQVWTWIIDNQLLFSTDYSQLRNLLDDAPKTNAFGEGSAPRTPAYIGWQIVRRYMKKNKKCTIEELLSETDSRKILNESGWRP